MSKECAAEEQPNILVTYHQKITNTNKGLLQKDEHISTGCHSMPQNSTQSKKMTY
uniref:Uncharacterized protein n=1 Tax=Arion vulgaris TaxID=1028688 RepID=A0A0B6ZU94_9EUPU